MSEVEYRRLANALPQIIWTCDVDGRLEWVNDRWYEVTGQTEADIANKGALASVHVDDVLQLQTRWAEAIASKTPCEIEYRIRTRSGAYRWHLARMSPVRNDDGTIQRWAAVAMDMHDRRMAEAKLHASERRFETAFELNPMPMVLQRMRDLKFLRVNAAFVQLTGYSREEAADTNAVKLGMWSAQERSANWARLGTGGVEVAMRVKDGSTKLVRLSGALLDHGEEQCLLVAAVDMTEQRETERALREADRRKDEFLALLSHELRNPLAPIVTAAQLMKLRGDPEGAHERDVILRQARHLSRLVDDLLDVSRIARGEIQLARQRLDLGRVIAGAVEATEPLFEQHRHQLRLNVADGLTVDGDEVRLTQIVSNLLTNAARYTPPGGRVEIRALAEGNEAVIHVIDNGRGLEASLLEAVFSMFVRGSRDKNGGLGLGLALVRSLVQLHGGTASAASDGPGHGSTFTVRLPLAEPAAAPIHEVTAPPTPTTPARRILVVDDNRDAAQLLATLLEGAGHHVRVAFDSPAALELVGSFAPEIAILDIGLPVMDGHDLARELRARLAMQPVLVALTGYGHPLDRARSKQAGFTFHLAKPVDVEAIAQLLASVSDPIGAA
ncbi:MAG: PAS domain S-box protein [Kofleriaceae bacterium]|nr:PAS domain S-box protein [Kofleriaceae bacterium]